MDTITINPTEKAKEFGNLFVLKAPYRDDKKQVLKNFYLFLDQLSALGVMSHQDKQSLRMAFYAGITEGAQTLANTPEPEPAQEGEEEEEE